MRPHYVNFIPPMMNASTSKSTWPSVITTTALSTFMLTATIPQHISAATLPQTSQSTSSSTTATATILDDEHALVDEAWRIVNKYFYDANFHKTDWAQVRHNLEKTKLPNRFTSYAAIRRSFHKLGDKYTRVLTPRDMLALRKYDISGVGLLLTGNEDGGDLVVATDPAEDTAAGRAGIKRGDVVLEIDGRNVRGVNAFTVAEWMQGANGSEMRVKFRKAGETVLIRDFTSGGKNGQGGGNSVRRTTVVLRNDERMGYIRLVDFEASSRLEIAAALKELKQSGAEWIVLDLRSNGGGVFEGALEIAGLLEGDGVPVVQVSGRLDDHKQAVQEKYLSRVVENDEDAEWGTHLDLGILMNKRSASSSEVLAGGLRDNCKAAVIGSERSFGKGLIQGVFGLSDGGGVVVTVGEYRTPSGLEINGVGLKSDIKLRRPFVDNALGLLGVERMTEDSFIVSHDDVKDALRLCREAKSYGK